MKYCSRTFLAALVALFLYQPFCFGQAGIEYANLTLETCPTCPQQPVAQSMSLMVAPDATWEKPFLQALTHETNRLSGIYPGAVQVIFVAESAADVSWFADVKKSLPGSGEPLLHDLSQAPQEARSRLATYADLSVSNGLFTGARAALLGTGAGVTIFLCRSLAVEQAVVIGAAAGLFSGALQLLHPLYTGWLTAPKWFGVSEAGGPHGHLLRAMAKDSVVVCGYFAMLHGLMTATNVPLHQTVWYQHALSYGITTVLSVLSETPWVTAIAEFWDKKIAQEPHKVSRMRAFKGLSLLIFSLTITVPQIMEVGGFSHSAKIMIGVIGSGGILIHLREYVHPVAIWHKIRRTWDDFMGGCPAAFY